MAVEKTVNRYEATLEEFRSRLEHWLAAYKFEEDTTLYSQEQWMARKETDIHADSCLLHMTSEGPWCSICNGYSREDGINADLLNNFAAYHGWFVEQGYHWSWHFMPLSQFDDEMEATTE